MEFDVVVAGGGSAGLAAAVSAARLGARTLLVERGAMLGGNVAAALVHSICGLYRLRGNADAPLELANTGFASEFAARLQAAGGAFGPVRLGRVDVLLQRPADFARVAARLARETPRLTLRLQTTIIAAAGESVTLQNEQGIENVRARVFVDATGDAALAALRGAPCEMAESSRLQRPAWIFALGDVAEDALSDDAPLRLARCVSTAVQAGALPPSALGAHFRAVGRDEVYVTIDLSGDADFDPLDAACLERLQQEGRALAEQLWRLLRKQVAGFAASHIDAWPSRLGVRESRRIVGRSRLEAEDIENSADFPDTVAFAVWPMELRETARGARLRFPYSYEPCGIPLRALRACDDDALFMAGRCISCSHEAQASVRVIGTCLATGEAAGLAAALQVLHGDCDTAGVNAARQKLAR